VDNIFSIYRIRMLHFLIKTTYVDLDRLVSDDNIELFELLRSNKLLKDVRGKFELACEKGELKFAQWLYNINNEYFWNSNYRVCLYNACIGGHLEMAKWIREIINDDGIIKSPDCKYIFSKVCEDGHFEMAKWLYKTYKYIDIHLLDDYAFRWTISNGHYKIAKWLYGLDGKIDLHINSDYAFIAACSSGNLRMAKWIYGLDKGFDLSLANYQCFRSACINGRLNIVKWLYALAGKDIFNKISIDNIFSNVCRLGHLNVAKWIINSTDIDVKRSKDSAFNGSCVKGFFNLAKWLYRQDRSVRLYDDSFFEICSVGNFNMIKWLNSICKLDGLNNNTVFMGLAYACKSDNLELCKWLYSQMTKVGPVDVKKQDNILFRRACMNGRIEIAKWLLTIDTNIEVSSNNHEAFITACNKGLIETVRWLTTINPKYYAKVENNKIHEFRTNNHIHNAYNSLSGNNISTICNYLDIKHNVLTGVEPYECCICDTQKDINCKLPCHHGFCLECILNWFIINDIDESSKCAICREHFKLHNISISIS